MCARFTLDPSICSRIGSEQEPAPGGVSIGHGNITAGTLGCLCTGRTAPRDDRMLVLSNNHVLADVNAGSAGDPIYQPGPRDGGTPAANQIGILERFVTIRYNSSGTNHVDCATAWVDANDVRPDLVYFRRGAQKFFRAAPPTVPARVGMTVGKSGRTTHLTQGRIAAIGVRIQVDPGGGQLAWFDDQMEIRGLSGNFSDLGDSGSLVWTWDGNRNPVGLLFAGGRGSTFANPIDSVLNSLDIDLVY